MGISRMAGSSLSILGNFVTLYHASGGKARKKVVISRNFFVARDDMDVFPGVWYAVNTAG